MSTATVRTPLPPEVVDLQEALAETGAVVAEYPGGDLAAYTASLRERLRVLQSNEGTWWRLTGKAGVSWWPSV